MIVLFFGDSLTLGVGDDEALGWVGRVSRELTRKGLAAACYNLGVRGNTIFDIKDRWLDELARRCPDVDMARLIFSFGAVDAVRGVDTDESVKSAEKLLRMAKAMSPRTVFITPPPVASGQWMARLTPLVRCLVGLCQDLDLPCLDLQTALAASDTYLDTLSIGDGIHPPSAGHEEIFRHVWPWPPLQAILAS